MTLLGEALEAVRRRRAEAAALGFDLQGVVGSVARGEARPDSDVDLLYAVCGPASLLDLAHLHLQLADELGRPVDMIDIRQVRPRMARELARDLVRA